MKHYISKIFVVFVIALFSSNIAFCQNDSEKKLKEDLVKVSDNEFQIDDFMLINIGEQQFQIKMTANAPTEVISRDNFISIYTSLGTVMMLSLFEEAGYSIAELDITELDELIGQPDITFNFIMAKNGMQIQIITDEGTERLTMTWEDIIGT